VTPKNAVECNEGDVVRVVALNIDIDLIIMPATINPVPASSQILPRVV
jgi:hypothetical protein